ncbi:related to SWR1-complex protein 4 [Saccharomycodes ludwigii]|uniref:SWR1-complex protein 4 n=1 Tax=Saccharomycodes ludwigii TaxID=36035 RepID=A0A376B3D7_9ASCO|nr:hypothetical protein SCDLUD_001467 [Saccharomycodes ludwigii]KAH3901696.1 hypothetical protein SCDLUD_001467 [Saccharomycodes ludwigii]SSD58640.1 related to SWR1-complex protein 4 [Saccharomycodes ludwigii]
MASSNDLFDMLNIQKKNSESPVPSSANSKKKQLTPKIPVPPMTGLQRELYSLLGDSLPPSVIHSNNIGTQFKTSFKMKTQGKPSPWTYAPFRPNEKSSFTLRHWVKGSKDLLDAESQVSMYSKFNIHYKIPQFDQQEFEKFMSEEDRKTYEFKEIQYLFDLCRLYDLKWIVILDRYDFEGKQRSVEDLKDMFYFVCRKYMQHIDPENKEILKFLDFPKEKEIERKQYLNRLLSRSSAEIAEEEALVIEAKRFEMAAKRTLAEREQLLRLLDSPTAVDDISIQQFLTSHGMTQFYNSLLADKSRKRKYDSVAENPWVKQQQQFRKQQKTRKIEDESKKEQENKKNSAKTKSQDNQENNGGSSGSNGTKRRQESEKAVQLINDPVTSLLREFNKDERKSLGIHLYENKLSPGVFLRSTKISSFKPAVQNKVQVALNELQIPTRPVMPTFDVVKKHDQLLKKITILLDLKKQVDKLEAENRIRG